METTKRTFIVKRVKKYKNSYLIYCKQRKEPFALPVKLCIGKLPPKFKWPWQKSSLEVETIGNLAMEAKFDGIQIYHRKEESLTPEQKDYIKVIEEEQRIFNERIAVHKKLLEKLLERFLINYSSNILLVNEIEKLPVCAKMWLKALFFNRSQDANNLKRLAMLAEFAQIADEIYQSTNNNEIMTSSDNFIYAHCPLSNILCFDQDGVIKDILRRHKFFLEDDAENHLINFLDKSLRDILCLYIKDVVYIKHHAKKDDYGNRRYSDKEEYRNFYKKMRLPLIPAELFIKSLNEEEFYEFMETHST